MNNQEIVQKLWNECNVLRDDGVSYQDYITELTYILFLKMSKEQDQQDDIPEKYRWDNLVSKEGLELKNFYRQLLLDLGNPEIVKSKRINAIYANASTAIDEQDTADNEWKAQLLDQVKSFSPAKFESFSRLLISKMGVKIDKVKGVKLSGDHGIDGFGYFRSDEFRTARVAIQCKRYTSGSVGESEIRDFKGTMDSFNAEYGIFVTTSSYTDTAKKIAIRGNRTVTLIDGQELCDLVEKYQLHITPVTTYTLDDYYFEKD